MKGPDELELTMEEEWEPFGQCYCCPNDIPWNEELCEECKSDSR